MQIRDIWRTLLYNHVYGHREATAKLPVRVSLGPRRASVHEPKVNVSQDTPLFSSQMLLTRSAILLWIPGEKLRNLSLYPLPHCLLPSKPQYPVCWLPQYFLHLYQPWPSKGFLTPLLLATHCCPTDFPAHSQTCGLSLPSPPKLLGHKNQTLFVPWVSRALDMAHHLWEVLDDYCRVF